jgi:drug/metabolite transporter (DMT)-like permease
VAENGSPAPRPPRNSMERGYAKAAQRNQEAREKLEPLAAGERPTVVTVAAIVCGLLALSIVALFAAGVKPEGEAPRFAQVAAPALITGVLAWGMWRARYWAVVGFQLVLAFLIFASFYGLALEAESLGGFLASGGLLVVSTVFFVLMVKAMARIQMPHRLPPAGDE